MQKPIIFGKITCVLCSYLIELFIAEVVRFVNNFGYCLVAVDELDSDNDKLFP